MSKLLKVRLEFDDKIMTLEGDEAEKWSSHNAVLALNATFRAGNQNPFYNDPVKWTERPVTIINTTSPFHPFTASAYWPTDLPPFDARSYERSYLAEQLD